MTTFARKGSTSIASHGKGALRKSVSSPAASAVLGDVNELVARLESRTADHCYGTVDPLQTHSNSSPRQYVVHEDLVVDIRSETRSTPVCGSSEHGQRDRPVAGAWGTRTPIPDGPVYSALRQELAKVKLEDCRSRPSSPPSDGSPSSTQARTAAAYAAPSFAAGASPAAPAQERRLQTVESSLDEARTSNRLLSRALSAVQQRLKQTEVERDQLRRERDYFRSLTLRFPFTLSVAGGNDSVYGAVRRFHSSSSDS